MEFNSTNNSNNNNNDNNSSNDDSNNSMKEKHNETVNIEEKIIQNPRNLILPFSDQLKIVR